MTLKVIGAGFGRTGTLSLKTALESLGYNKCYHMIELLNQPQQVKYWERASQREAVAWDTLFEDYQPMQDYPQGYHLQSLTDWHLEYRSHHQFVRTCLTIKLANKSMATAQKYQESLKYHCDKLNTFD